MLYVIYVHGKRHTYATLEAAMRVASEIHQKTGVIVGIARE